MERNIMRGDIYYANLNPVVGSEQSGSRPVLIISNDIGNKHSPTVIIAAITSRLQTKNKIPTHYSLSNIEGLPENSIVLLEQIRTIDKKRLEVYLARLSKHDMETVNKPLLISIGVKKSDIPSERNGL